MIYDTIAAIATPLNPSGIGIIRLSGNQSIEIVDNLFISNIKGKKLSKVLTHTLNYGKIMDSDNGKIIDEVLVSVMKKPNSYTKEDVVEINCHGGIVVMKKVITLLLKQGIRLAEPGEFTKRAFLNGRIDLSQAEAVMDIINSKTEMALESSVNQLNGTIKREIEEIKFLVLDIIAHIEASIDYPEYDIDELTEENLLISINKIKTNIVSLLTSYDNGRMIREGIKTVIVGKPNVGKSSLLNALLRDQRAIVTDIPGTTRDILEEYMNIHGIPLRLIDTAGIRATEDIVEQIGVNRAKDKISEADLVIFMVDASESITEEDIKIFDLINEKRTIVLLNKIDLNPKIDIDKIKEYIKDTIIIPVSVKNLHGIEILENEIRNMFEIGNINFNDNIYITNVRHKNALDKALTSLDEIIKSVNDGMPIDCLAIDLKNVYDSIGELTGDSVKDDLIEQIFSNFCLGK